MPRPATTIQGTLRLETVRLDPSSDPVKGFRVVLYDAESSASVGEATVDEEGGYAIRVNEGQATQQARMHLYAVVVDPLGHLVGDTSETAVWFRGSRHMLDLTIAAGDPGQPTIRVGACALDAGTVASVSPKRALAAARAVVRGKEVEPWFSSCGSGRPTTLEALVNFKAWPREILLEFDDIMTGRISSSPAHVYNSANFSVTYYTAEGDRNAVASDNSACEILEPGGQAVRAALPAGGPPTYVKRVCYWLEQALAVYVNPPFSLRNPAASGRIPVEVNAHLQNGRATANYFVINNTLEPDILAAVCVHELFHKVQYEYPGLDGPGPWAASMKEGGAVWAEDAVMDLVNRYLYEAGTPDFNGPGVLVRPQTSLESASYKCALFWRYIAEQQSPHIDRAKDARIGLETYRPIIEECSTGGWATDDVKRALRGLPWYQDFYEFGYVDPAGHDLTSSETTLGNYALAAYLKDVGRNKPDRRFDFMENAEAIAFDKVASTVDNPIPAQAKLAELTVSGRERLTSAGSVSFVNAVPRFGSRYYEVGIDRGVRSVHVQFVASPGLSSVIFQIVLIDEHGDVREIYRTDRGAYVKQFPNERDLRRLDRVVLVVTAADSSGMFSVTATPARPAPDVMVTRWNSVVKTEYEIDPRDWSWTWVSPDIWIDNDSDASADPLVVGRDNKLFVRLHNKGNAPARGISVELHYQDASGGLSPTGWFPVQDAAGITQTLSGLLLRAGASKRWSVDWSPVSSRASQHFCVRVTVAVPGDPNTDNKRAMSNLGHVSLKPGGFAEIELFRRNVDAGHRRVVETMVVPRASPDLRVAERDVAAVNGRPLEASEVVRDILRVNHWPVHHPANGGDGFPVPGRRSFIPARLNRADPIGHYPIQRLTLPPGVAGKAMVTIVHLVDGFPQGGVTFLVSLEDERRRKPARKVTARSDSRRRTGRRPDVR